jgi:hypothetical protein
LPGLCPLAGSGAAPRLGCGRSPRYADFRFGGTETVFGGSIIRMGVGDIDYPNLWQPANQLGYCGGIPPSNPPSRVFDLSGGQASDWQSAGDAALGSVMQTELPNGLALGGHLIVNAAVLLYPRTVGMFDPSTAEWPSRSV